MRGHRAAARARCLEQCSCGGRRASGSALVPARACAPASRCVWSAMRGMRSSEGAQCHAARGSCTRARAAHLESLLPLTASFHGGRPSAASRRARSGAPAIDASHPSGRRKALLEDTEGQSRHCRRGPATGKASSTRARRRWSRHGPGWRAFRLCPGGRWFLRGERRARGLGGWLSAEQPRGFAEAAFQAGQAHQARLQDPRCAPHLRCHRLRGPRALQTCF